VLPSSPRSSDDAFLADTKQLGMEINPVRGEDVELLVTRIMGTPAALAQRAPQRVEAAISTTGEGQ
jgi:hypothetical protein